MNDIAECLLSAPPGDPNSILLLTRFESSTFTFCRVFKKQKKRLEKGKWMRISFLEQLKKITWKGEFLTSFICWNGRVFALCTTDSEPDTFVVEVKIHVGIEVSITLLTFGVVFISWNWRGGDIRYRFLSGSRSPTDLFYLAIAYRDLYDVIPVDVYISKLDMTSINWIEVERIRKVHLTIENKFNLPYLFEIRSDQQLWAGVDLRIRAYVDFLCTLGDSWAAVEDLNEGIFVVDLEDIKYGFYNPAIQSELGGCVCINDRESNLIYTYHIRDKTLITSRVPIWVPPRSHMSMWDCWSKDDEYKEGKSVIDIDSEEKKVAVSLIRDVEGIDSLLLDIPTDLLELIVKRCVAIEYLNLRATCKSICLVAPRIKWGNQTELGRLKNYTIASPFLVVVDPLHSVLTFTDPFKGEKYFMTRSPLPIYEDTICCSRFGWLLFKTDDWASAFYNPFTNELRELPETDNLAHSFWFSAPPTSPDCVVYAFSFEGVEVHHVSGGPTWLRAMYPTEHTRFTSFPTAHDNNYYCLCYPGRLMVIKNLGELHVSIEQVLGCPVSSSGPLPAPQYFLVKCGVDLFLIGMTLIGYRLVVFKLIHGEWVEVFHVGKNVLYISDTNCIGMEAKIPEMENKIFLAQTGEDKVVFYCLESMKYYTFSAEGLREHLGDFCSYLD